MAQVVYTSLTDGNEAQGTLFKGIRFWLSRKVPQRSRFIKEIQTNGGEVFPLEKQADILIVDHARKEALPGTYSYRFIEKSIQKGTLERLSDHAVGPPVGTIRAVGSSTHPAKIGRQKFTEEDDRILLDWVESSLRNGARTEGNEIYKQLQAKNPRHPWQSWRDRWVKYLRDTCPIATSDAGSIPSPTDDLEGSEAPQKNHVQVLTEAKTRIGFSEEDMKILLENGEHIHDIPSENVADAWKAWACEHDEQRRTAQEWQDFWEKTVLPIYIKRANRRRKSSVDSESDKIPLVQKQISKLHSVQSPVVGKTHPHAVGSREPQSPEIPYASESSSPSSRSNDVSKTVIVEDPIVENSIVEDPIVEDSIVEDPIVEYPIVEDPIVEDPIVEDPIVEDPIVEDPKPDSSESPEEFYPAVETPTAANLSPKRKRAASEEEFPSSSLPYHEPSSKRQRRQEGSMPAEIAPTPERSPIYNHDFSPSVVTSQNFQEFLGSIYEDNIDEDDDGHDEKWENENEKEDLIFNGNRSISDDEDSVEDEKVLGRQASPVLSEPKYKIIETQTSLNESTPFIDFDVAPPENGWGEPESGASKLSPSLPSLTYRSPAHVDSKTTQIPTIEESQTLLPDFSIPPPDGGWENIESSSLPPSSDSPNSDSFRPNSPTQSEIPDLLDAWIDEHIASGFSSDEVISSLEHTSLDKELAEIVLAHMKHNQGSIPMDMAGVWTGSDDEGIQSTDAQRYRDVEQKHGSENIEKRWIFLNECNECRRIAEGS